MSKRLFTWILAFVLLFGFHTGRARMSTDGGAGLGTPDEGRFTGEIPRPPLKGRREGGPMRHLLKPETGYATWLARGKAYVARREFEQAIWAFRKALRERPLAEEAHFLLGCVYVARGAEGLPGDVTAWDDLAESAFRAAIKLADHLPSRYNLGILLTRRGNPSEARLEFEHILNVKPSSSLGRLAREALDRNIQADLLPRMLAVDLPDLPGETRIGAISADDPPFASTDSGGLE